jgi:hypothetical protein
LRKLVVLALALGLAGCATAPPRQWARIDGHPIDPAQFQVDRTICLGEMQKANLSSTAEHGYARGRAVVDVLDGCMAQRGYLGGPY